MAALQEILTYCLVGLGLAAEAGIKNQAGKEERPSALGQFISRALVATHGTSAADPHRLVELIQQSVVLRDQFKELVPAMDSGTDFPSGPANFQPATTFEGLLSQARQIRPEGPGAANTPTSFLKRILLAGLRSVSTYADHAFFLGRRDDRISAFLIDHLIAVYRSDADAEELIRRIRMCGSIALRTMAFLEDTCTRAYGAPLASTVSIGVQRGEAILVAGRNFHDLEALLEQTQNAGIRVYTYGDMLDAHQYPILKQYPQFSGHYEPMHQLPEDCLSCFPGPVVLTGGSPVPDEPLVRGNVFSSGELNVPGIFRISHRNFGPVIDHALAMEGFSNEETLGNTVVGSRSDGLSQTAGRLSNRISDPLSDPVSDKIPNSNKGPNTKKLLLVAHCRDGQAPLPWARTDGVSVLTCNPVADDLKTAQKADNIFLGTTHDPGAVVRVVKSLAASLETDVASLPLTVNLSWQGQKTAGAMLALLSLGLKDIRLGPTLPTGISPDCLETLEQGLGIRCHTIPPGCER